MGSCLEMWSRDLRLNHSSPPAILYEPEGGRILTLPDGTTTTHRDQMAQEYGHDPYASERPVSNGRELANHTGAES